MQPGGHKQGLETTLITKMLEFVIRLWNKNGLFLLVQEKIFLIKLIELKEILDGKFLGLPRLIHLSGKQRWAWKQVTSVHIFHMRLVVV